MSSWLNIFCVFESEYDLTNNKDGAVVQVTVWMGTHTHTHFLAKSRTLTAATWLMVTVRMRTHTRFSLNCLQTLLKMPAYLRPERFELKPCSQIATQKLMLNQPCSISGASMPQAHRSAKATDPDCLLMPLCAHLFVGAMMCYSLVKRRTYIYQMFTLLIEYFEQN